MAGICTLYWPFQSCFYKYGTWAFYKDSFYKEIVLKIGHRHQEQIILYRWETMISGTNRDYGCVQHVGSLHQYKSAATSAEWDHVVAEHSMNLWHSSIAFREIFLSQGSKKSENRNIFNVGCVNRPVMCAYNKIRLHIPDNCRYWMRNYREINRKERLAIPRKQSQLGQFRYAMPPRPIFPGKSHAKEHSVVRCSSEP